MKLGVTGGIGSGKTTVCRIFGVLGIPVFSADEDARKIMESDKRVVEQVKKIAGEELYSSGMLNRTELARLIFHDKDLLMEINKVVHPVVSENFLAWEKTFATPYVIMEAAILFESGGSRLVDKIVTIIAPVEERIERVVQRNNLSRKEVLERIKNQLTDEDKISRSDWVINNSEHEMIIPSVLKIHNEMLSLINRDK